ncbi:MAG: hypothetical protein ACKO96_21200 [Flammeovirgaceae bacterium]
MNDQIKQNRALLKANKKEPFKKITAKGKSDVSHNDPKASETERLKIVRQSWEASHREIVTLYLMGILVMILVTVLLVLILS